MTEYTLICGDESIKVPSRFIHNCSAFTNMFEDTDSDNPDEPIPITDQFSKENIEAYIKLFTVLDNLKVDFANTKLSYLDYITEHREHYIENYTNKYLDPPHCQELAEMLTSKGESKMVEILSLDSYFDNKKLRCGVMLIIAAFVRVGPIDEIEKIISSIMDVVQNSY